MCAEARAARARLAAAERLAVAAYRENYGIDVGLRRVFRPLLLGNDWERLLGRFDQVEEEKKQ
jgi:DNA repair photolyase